MSYQDDLRGALASTSGAARRSQALAALGLSDDDQGLVRGYLDDATSSLMEAIAVLTRNGLSATGTASVVKSAQATKSDGWQSLVYGGRKEARTVSEVMTEQRAKTAAHKQPVEVDISHPWRSGEERSQ